MNFFFLGYYQIIYFMLTFFLYTYMGKSYSLQASGEVGQLLLQPQHVPLRAAFDEGCHVASKASHRHRDRGHGR